MKSGVIILFVLALFAYANFYGVPSSGIIIGFVVIGLIGIIASAKAPAEVKSHWQTYLDDIQVSTDDFYTLVEDNMKSRKIAWPNVAREKFFEKSIVSAKREYLRITDGEYVFYVCAATYGTGTFFSSWLCVKDEHLFNKIPIVSVLLGKSRTRKTFYQMDTEAMFLSTIHNVVVAAVNSLSESNGLRALSEFETQYKDAR